MWTLRASLLLFAPLAFGAVEITRPLMSLQKDGVEISRHTSEVEAMERASESEGEYQLIRPTARIVVTYPAPQPQPQPEPQPEPVDAQLPSFKNLGQITQRRPEVVRVDGAAGDREEIGLFTEWQAEYLATGNGRNLIISQADVLLDAPWDDLAEMRRESWREPPGEYGLSFSHTPNVFFLPYLLTGDSKYVAPMEAQYKIYQEYTNGPDADGSMKWLTGRDLAWQLRNLGQLAFIQEQGDTVGTDYIGILEKTRLQLVGRMQNPINAEFHVLGENRLGNEHNWTGWFEGFIGMTVNHLINLGFTEWQSVAEWHFQHLIDRCGGKWPLKACDNSHVTFPDNNGGTWANTAPFEAWAMDCYNAAPNDNLVPVKCGTGFITYEDRAQIARSWAAMAAENGIQGAADLYAKIDTAIKARGDTLKFYKYSILTSAESTPEPVPPAGSNADLMNAVPGTWVEIPDSKIADILPPESFNQPIRYTVGPKAIMTAWNGGVFNTKLQRLDIFTSGGHADYCGNEYMGFSLETLKWTLVHGPSDLTGFDLSTGQVNGAGPKGYAPDGKPISRHTYGGQVYHPILDKSFMFGGSVCSGAGTPDDRWWSVTADGQYKQLGGNGAWSQLGWSSVYDPNSGDIYLSISGRPHRYDVKNNVIRSLTNLGSSGRTGQVIALDTKRNRLFAFGHAKLDDTGFGSIARSRPYLWDIATGTHRYVTLSGDLTLQKSYGVGLHYIPESDVFVAWKGGNKLYVIDPETFNITAYQTEGIAPPANPNGVYGRFAYSAIYGGFVVVTDIYANVRFLKMPEIN